MHATGALPLYIPSPPINGFHIGPLDIHFYALGYIIGIIFAVLITRRRWAALGGDPDLVGEIALWVVPAGIIGGRIYFDVTTPADIPHVWYGPLAVWTGGLGIWGGVLAATLVGAWRLRKLGITVGPFANAIAPALLVAQGIGRLGNYFNKELFGKPTTLPWGLEIPFQYRQSGGIPAADLHFSTFQPSFLYELIWDLALALVLIWIGRRFTIKPWALFALYVAGYSGYRIFEESIRVDSSEYFLGLRLNFFVAIFGTVAGLIWFIIAQRRPEKPFVVRSPLRPDDDTEAESSETEASEAEAREKEVAKVGAGSAEPIETDFAKIFASRSSSSVVAASGVEAPAAKASTTKAPEGQVSGTKAAGTKTDGAGAAGSSAVVAGASRAPEAEAPAKADTPGVDEARSDKSSEESGQPRSPRFWRSRKASAPNAEADPDGVSGAKTSGAEPPKAGASEPEASAAKVTETKVSEPKPSPGAKPSKSKSPETKSSEAKPSSETKSSPEAKPSGSKKAAGAGPSEAGTAGASAGESGTSKAPKAEAPEKADTPGAATTRSEDPSKLSPQMRPPRNWRDPMGKG